MTISSRPSSPCPTSSDSSIGSHFDYPYYPQAHQHSHSNTQQRSIHSGHHPLKPPRMAVAVVSANSAQSHSHSSPPDEYPSHIQSALHHSSSHSRQYHHQQHQHYQQTPTQPSSQAVAQSFPHRPHAHSPHATSPLNPSPRAPPPLSFASATSPLSPRRPLGYPLPLSSDQHLAAVALMQERQESWTRIAQNAASSSSASTASSPAGSVSPIQSVRGLGAPGGFGSSDLGGPSGSGSGIGAGAGGNGTGMKTKGGKSGKPRKKVAKACLACQKSHLTCDERESRSPLLQCLSRCLSQNGHAPVASRRASERRV